MAYIPPETLKAVKQIDVTTYLETYEPNELNRVCSGVYALRSDKTVKISNGQWCWWGAGGGIGGKTALSFLEKVRGMAFLDAAAYLAGLQHLNPAAFANLKPTVKPAKKPFKKPIPCGDNDAAIQYLKKRGIAPDVIEHFASAGRIYQSRYYDKELGRSGTYVTFLNHDEHGKPRYAFSRLIEGSGLPYREAGGSDKAYSFCSHSATGSGVLHLHESAIDLLSYLSMARYCGKDWQRDTHLSLGGVALHPHKRGELKMPIALQGALNRLPVTELVTHFDNDEAGRKASEALDLLFAGTLPVTHSPPPEGKDTNQYLTEFFIPNKRNHRQQQAAPCLY